MKPMPPDHYPTGPPLGWGPVVVVTREVETDEPRTIMNTGDLNDIPDDEHVTVKLSNETPPRFDWSE